MFTDLLDYLAYLGRYPAAIFFLAAALILFFRAASSLRVRFQHQSTPVKGFFLIASDESGERVQSFPLFHTSSLGRALSSDICLNGRYILCHHAQIYLFNRRWYISRVSADADVRVNGRKIAGKHLLKHEDRILLPGCEFTFIDERSSAEEIGVDFEATWTREQELFDEDARGSRGAWFCFSFFYFLIYAQLLLLLPGEPASLKMMAASFGGSYYILLFLFGQIWSRLFDHFDLHIYYVLALLSGLGLIFQMRLSLLNRTKPVDWSMERWLRFLQSDLIKVVIFYFVGLALLPLLISLISRTHFLEKMAPLCVVLTPALYLVTRFLGSDTAGTGARLWLILPGGFSLQLTEFAKISYLIVLAWLFMIRPPLRHQWLFALWAGINFMLMLWMPDLGSMMLLLPVTLLVFTVMTSEYIKTAIILSGGIGIFALAYRILPYVRSRIHGWLTLWTEVNAQNDQIIRGLQAMAQGGLFGLGLGRAEPRAIPLASSDMIFSFLCEELGLLSGIALVMAFVVIWLRAAYAVTRIRDGFSCGLILAVSSAFFVEAAVVIGGCSGLIPLTGATLPFISRGGSSMMAKWILAGILLGLGNRREEERYKSR